MSSNDDLSLHSSVSEYPPLINYKNLNNSSIGSNNNSNNNYNNISINISRENSNINNSSNSILSTLSDSITSLFKSSSSVNNNSNQSYNNNNNNNYNNSNNTSGNSYNNSSGNMNMSGNSNISGPLNSPQSSTRYTKSNGASGGNGILGTSQTSNGNYNDMYFFTANPNTMSPQTSTNSLLAHQPTPIIDDFVVLSEFSEQAGPMALNIIPDHTFLFSGSFDLPKYVVKIMSVDFQNKTNDLKTYAKDSQMFYTVTNNDKNEIYAYVHHFSLFDIYARGYVRPLVLSYLTRDPHKIIRYFDKFIFKFNQLTTLLKSKNHVLFEIEYQQRKKDLEFTLNYYSKLYQQQEKQQKELNSNGDGNGSTTTPNITNGGDYDSSSDGNTAKDTIYTPDEVTNIYNIKQQSLSDIMASIGDIMSEMQSIENLFEQERKIQSSNQYREKSSLPFYMESSLGTIHFSNEPIETSDPKILDSINKTGHLDKPLRLIHEIAPNCFDKFLHKLEQCYKYFSNSTLQMEFDSLDIQAIQNQSSLLAIGQTNILNFRYEMDCKRSYNKSQMKEIHKPKTATSSSMKIKSFSHNSLSSYSSDPSSYLSVMSSTSLNEIPNFELSAADIIANNSATNSFNNYSSIVGSGGSGLPNIINRYSNAHVHSSNQQKYETFSNYLWSTNKRPLYGRGLLKFLNRYVWLRHVVFSLLKGRPVVIIGSVDKEQQIIAMVYALSIFTVGQPSPASGGKEIFHPWKTTPLMLNDLCSLKLVGMPKVASLSKSTTNPLIPINVVNYITKIDLDSEEFYGPLYSNSQGVIDEILGQKKQWINENIYTGHIETQLFELAIKSFYYYHLTCVPLTVDHFNNATSGAHSRYAVPHPSTHPSPQHSNNNSYSSYSNIGHSPRSTSNNSTTQQPIDHSQTLSYSTGILPSYHMSTLDNNNNNSTSGNSSLSSSSNSKFSLAPNVIQNYTNLLPPQTSKLTYSSKNPPPSRDLKATRSLSESQIKTNLLPKFNIQQQPQAQIAPHQNNNNNNSLLPNSNSSSNLIPNINSSNGIQINSSSGSIKSLSSISPVGTPTSSPNHTMNKSIKFTDSRSLFKRWEVSTHDQIIIEYLAEVVKDQQYYEAFQQIEVAPIIKLDYSPLVLVKNKK
ncbi:hypothetical protein DLAC_00547 [Tieghemostelium lacteum]|uniref:UDENN FLCN/SMCR8-type domain-containing protein n=1 Tax=Tieghemostelium lacteum TaxID=361077 RepID=A0A152AA07_TIELA|nr:hypothetical protein DLAC_00547 [Tieghemostelium lacteum]|eukprot:KYR03056.1 hypothetical protein DLAC_00547 [Tieghemostelium lacteum]